MRIGFRLEGRLWKPPALTPRPWLVPGRRMVGTDVLRGNARPRCCVLGLAVPAAAAAAGAAPLLRPRPLLASLR